MKRFLRFALLILLGFIIGGGAAYVTQMRKFRAIQPDSASLVKPYEVTQGTDGRLKVKKDPVQEAINAAKEGKDPVAAENKAIAHNNDTTETHAAAPEDDANAATTKGVEGILGAKPIKLAHSEPGIGMYVPGTFTLKDTDGHEVTEKSWPGKYLLVFFGFTHCPDICPVTLDKMTQTMKKLGDLADKAQPLFITVDPERDNAETMKTYLANYDKSIIGLTGTVEQIKAAEDSFKVYAAKAAGDGENYSVDHSAFVYLMSPHGRLEEVLRIEQGTDAVVEKIRPYLDGTHKESVLTP